MMELHTQAAERGVQCRALLRERIGPDKPITTATLIHGDGTFSVKAFHTVLAHRDRENFVREVVVYDTYGTRHAFDHIVRNYYSGHHEQYITYTLEEDIRP